MTVVHQPPGSFAQKIDHEKGLVDRSIFSDPETYRIELDRIFGRAWLFLAHESQIPNSGDFFQNYMGEDRVIVTRARDNSVQVLVNSCMHRGNSVCKADSGTATSFMCSYHGWTYDLEGKLVGVPGFKELYNRQLEKEKWGLRKAAWVDTYRGFIFATLDPDAPALSDYLGATGRYMIDTFANQGDMVVVPGIMKHRIPSNWKMLMENDQDYYHPGITHASYLEAVGTSFEELNAGFFPIQGRLILGEYGHCADTIAGFDHANIFPHLGLLSTSLQMLELRLPKGPQEMENWYFCFTDKNASEEQKLTWRMNQIRRVGPAGMVEQDDGENFQLSTRGSASSAARDTPFNYQLGLGHGKMVDDAEAGFPVIESNAVNEEYMRWQHRAWAEWMDADSWQTLKATHSRPGVA